jgi:hypothetical protein
VANRIVELHDTRVERIERAGGTVVLWMSACLHESDGRPARDRGTVWNLPARLVIENGDLDRPFPSQSLWVTDGHIAVGDRLFDGCLPLPFDESGAVRLCLSGPEGQLVVWGGRAYLQPTGEPTYIEEFP